MSEIAISIEPVVAGETDAASRTIERIRGVLVDAEAAGAPPGRDPFERLVLDVVTDLVEAAVRHDWDDVVRVDVEATEGSWRATVRLTRDADLREHVCNRGRTRGWR